MVMVMVWTRDVFTPPLFVPPESTALRPTVTVPPEAAGVKVRVPLGLMAGETRKRAGLLFVTVNVTVWLLSFVGPAWMFVTALGTVTATSYLSTVTFDTAMLNEGA